MKINKTVIADTSDDGNSFFFHSSTFHHPALGNEYPDPDEEEEEVEHEFTDKKEDEVEVSDDGNVELSGASASTTTTTTTTTTFGLVPRIEDEDESLNDVLADVDKNKTNSDANKGIDDGLVTIEAVQK